MAMTLEGVRARIDLDELNYGILATELGEAALPHLKTLAAGRDAMLASKAAYLAALIGGAEATPVLDIAQKRSEAEVRVAVASALHHLEEAQAEGLAERLLADADIGVRKMTMRAAAKMRFPKLKSRLQALGAQDVEPFIRDLAGNAPQ